MVTWFCLCVCACAHTLMLFQITGAEGVGVEDLFFCSLLPDCMPVSAWQTHSCKSDAREPSPTPAPPSNLCPVTPPVATMTSCTVEFIQHTKLFHTLIGPLSKHSKGPIPIRQWEYGGSEVYSYLCSWAAVQAHIRKGCRWWQQRVALGSALGRLHM